MQNNEYWETRAENKLLNAENISSDYLDNIKKVFNQCIKDIQNKIFAFYGKYSTETGLSLVDVQKRLNPDELKSFKEQLQIYMDEVKKVGGYSPTTKNWLKELSAKAYVSRLESLKAEMQWVIENIYMNENKYVFDSLKKAYEDTYYRSIFDIQQGIGFAYQFDMLDLKKIEIAVNQKWLESDFSSRIWNDKAKLLDTLNQKIPQSVASGQGSKPLARELSKILNTKYSNAERLARTEMNNIANQATEASYKTVPTEILSQYKILVTLDNRTSEICQKMDGKIFNVKDAKVGINMPPFHPHCRSTTVPYFKDMPVSEYGRIATDYSTGKAYYVPSDMTYKEWRASLTEAQEKAFIANKKIREQHNADKKQLSDYRKLQTQANKKGLGELFEEFPTTLNKFQQMKYLEPEKWEVYKSNARIIRSEG